MVRGDPADQREAVARALDAGITYFDTAPSYGDGRSEENLGRALRELGAWDRVVVGTKVRLSPEDRADAPAAIRRSIEQSLSRLGRDTVDLLQLHNRVEAGAGGDGTLAVEDVLGGVAEGFRRVIDAGLVRYAGFTGIGAAGALGRMVASGGFATVQCYFNAVNPSAGFAGASGGGHDFAGLINGAATAGMGVIAIRVLAAGALSGVTDRAVNASGVPATPLVVGGEFDRDIARTQRLDSIVGSHGLESSPELGVRFALSNPGVSTVLVGYSNVRQLDDAIRWAERGPLPEQVVQQVVALAR